MGISAPSIAGLVILVRLTGLLQSWEWAAFDYYMRLIPQLPPDDRIVIVGIDEADLRYIKQGIVPDEVYANLIEKLKTRHPRAIGFDIYRDLPVPPGHQELVKVFTSTPNLVGIEKVVGDSSRDAVAPPPTLKALGQVGANDLILDADNKVRRGLLSLTAPNGETVYSFGLYVALLYLQKEGIAPQIVAGTDNWWRLGTQVLVPFEENDGGYVRATASGYQVLLNYRGRSFDTVSMTDILKERVPKDWGRDRIILIGTVGESFNDSFFTPYSGGLFAIPKPMSGVEIQAHLASQLLSIALDGRPLIKSWSEPWEWLWILLWSGAGAVLTWMGRYKDGVGIWSFSRTVAPMLAVGVLLGSTCIAFAWSWWLPVVPPFLGLTGSAVAITAYIARTAGSIRQTFGRYLTDEVVAKLLESPEGLKLGGQRQKITILTSDLRGFTALSEQLSPEEVVSILNIYLKSMLEVIAQYQGTIDKFMGDGILVLFGAPTVRADDAKRAIACAVAMQLAMMEVNKELERLGFPSLQMGIGINTGECVLGNIGSEQHTEYTVIGREINLAFRIEAYTTSSQILISEATLQEVGRSLLRIDGYKQVQTKGVKEAIAIYEVGGIGDEYNLFLPKEEEDFLLLPAEINLSYQILDGKKIGNTLFKGRLVKLSAKGAEVRAENGLAESIPPPLSQIKLNFFKADGYEEISEDMYASVLEQPASQGTFYIHFTFKPPAVAVLLDALYEFIKD